MNTKLNLTAIALFAVTMGIGFLTPALAAPLPKISVCHFDEITTDADGITSGTDDWIVISINQNAQSAHVPVHTDGTLYDFVVNDTDGDDTNDSQDCTDRNL